MATLTPSPKMQFFDANGNPLVGGKLYTYAAGSTTPLATYTDSGAGTSNTNPVILDSRGEASVWLGTSLYYMELKSAVDALIWTADNIGGIATLSALAASGGSSLVGFIQAGSGATSRTVQSKLRDFVSARDFGAVGNGIADDTTAIQNCINSVSSTVDGTGTSGTVYFPVGLYKISSKLTVPPGVVLMGSGEFSMTNLTVNQGSVITSTHNGIAIQFTRTNASPGNLWHLGGMKNLSVSGPGAGTSVKLVELGDSANVDTSHGAWNGFIHNCSFNFSTTGYGIYGANSQSWDIRNNVFKSVKYPIYYNTVIAGSVIDHNTFDNSSLTIGNAGIAIFMRPGTLGGSVGTTITNNYAIGFDYGIHLVSIGGATITGNQLEGIFYNPILMTKYLIDGITADGTGCTGCYIEGNTFINWAASVAAYFAIYINYSSSNYIGKNCYQSPNGAAAGCIGVFDNTTTNNIFVKPFVTGSNPTIPPFPTSNAVMALNTVIAENYYQFPSNNVPSTSGWGSSEKGRIYYDTDKLSIFGKGPSGSDPSVLRIPAFTSKTSTNGGATIDITGCKTVVIRNSAPQTVSAFTDNSVYPGKEVMFYADSDANTTFALALGTRGGINYTLPQYASITFEYVNSTVTWSEKCRKD